MEDNAAPMALTSVLRVEHEPALHRVAMYVAQFLNPLALAPHVEIVEAGCHTWTGSGQNSPCPSRRRFRRKTRRVKRCLSTCMAVEGVPCSGSLISR